MSIQLPSPRPANWNELNCVPVFLSTNREGKEFCSKESLVGELNNMGGSSSNELSLQKSADVHASISCGPALVGRPVLDARRLTWGSANTDCITLAWVNHIYIDYQNWLLR